MIKYLFALAVLIAGGCTTVQEGVYRPETSKEKTAFSAADRSVTPADVLNDFHALENSELAWAGIIKDIQFKETPRAIQVAFQIDHRMFDWAEHSGDKTYCLSSAGDGVFVAGWTVRRPASIAKLKSLAPTGSMILVYGKPYQMKNGVVQLTASALRIIKEKDFEVLDESAVKVPEGK